MRVPLKPNQVLTLWFLIGQGGSAWWGDIRPEPSAADRKALEKATLIFTEKRGRRYWIEVTDAGWAWANDNLDASLSAKTKSVGPIFQSWLTRLHAFMQRQSLTLADVIVVGEKEVGSSDGTPASLEDSVRRAYLDSTGGIWNERVRLSELRSRLGGIERKALDTTLLKMQQASKLILFRLDNQREITNDDHEASLLVGGEPRHVLRMGG